MNLKKRTLGLIAAAAIVMGANPANACTGLQLTTKDHAVINGRTVEFGVFLDTSVVFVPRGYKFTGSTTLGPGKKWSSKYASIGMILVDNKVIVDGMNEKGLATASFYFPGYAKYSVTTKENQKISMSSSDFTQWILSEFATVDEVKKAIENNEVAISPVLTPGFPPQVQPFHFIVYDRSGKSIVIEPLDGKLKIYDNPIGVITNSPTFDWHMTNLRNYVNLLAHTPEDVKVFGATIKPLGQGAGMLGLPGDFTPPSRFVRAAAFAASSIPAETADKGVLQVFHILNSFDIPVGAARTIEDGEIFSDYTMLTLVRDTKNLRLYYKTYDDQTIKMVDMKKFDFNGKKILRLHTKTEQSYENVTGKLK